MLTAAQAPRGSPRLLHRPLRPQAWALSRWSAGLQGSWAGMRWVAGGGGPPAEEGTAAEVRAVFTVAENGESLEPATENSLGHT